MANRLICFYYPLRLRDFFLYFCVLRLEKSFEPAVSYFSICRSAYFDRGVGRELQYCFESSMNAACGDSISTLGCTNCDLQLQKEPTCCHYFQLKSSNPFVNQGSPALIFDDISISNIPLFWNLK